jgi:hypothetical protein
LLAPGAFLRGFCCLGRGACAVALGREPLPEDEEEPTELGALRVGETREELGFGVALCLCGAFKLLFTGSGEGDDVPAPVGCVARARKVAVGFERVEQRDEDAGIDVHERAELALGHRAAIVQQAEQVELPRRQPVLGVSRPQSPHRVLTQEREQ